MIQTVVQVPLFVGEDLEIRKNRITGGPGRRLCLVTGTHGDELEGQYVAWRLGRLLQEQPEALHGTVDIYPALNPLGINTMNRTFPLSGLDMNRTFPGSGKSGITEFVAQEIVEDLRGADLVIDVHASNIFLRESPQVRVNVNTTETLMPLAKQMNMDFIWVHAAATVLESTLAHSLNSVGTPTLVVEMGVGMRITPEYGAQLMNGLQNVMKYLGMWSGEIAPPRKPIISTDGHVSFINAGASGIFLPAVSHTAHVEAGQKLGIIADPLTGAVVQTLESPAAGWLFTLREYPVVYEGSLIARILGGVEA